MAEKTTGAEFKKFYSDPVFWPDGVWHDDEVVLVDGVAQDDLDPDMIPDASKVVIECGVVFLHDDDGEGVALDTYFRRWLKVQTTRSLVVEVSAEKLDAVVAAIKAAGGKVI